MLDTQGVARSLQSGSGKAGGKSGHSSLARSQEKVQWPGHQGAGDLVLPFQVWQRSDGPRLFSHPSQHWPDANGLLLVLGTQERRTRVSSQGQTAAHGLPPLLPPLALGASWATEAAPQPAHAKPTPPSRSLKNVVNISVLLLLGLRGFVLSLSSW